MHHYYSTFIHCTDSDFLIGWFVPRDAGKAANNSRSSDNCPVNLTFEFISLVYLSDRALLIQIKLLIIILQWHLWQNIVPLFGTHTLTNLSKNNNLLSKSKSVWSKCLTQFFPSISHYSCLFHLRGKFWGESF